MVLVLAGTLLALTPLWAVAETRVVDLTIRTGTLAADERVIRVSQGDTVTLRWTSDRVLTLHLHGYDIEQRMTVGTPAEMRFVARATGRFAIEVHAGPGGREATLGYLEVHPR